MKCTIKGKGSYYFIFCFYDCILRIVRIGSKFSEIQEFRVVP